MRFPPFELGTSGQQIARLFPNLLPSSDGQIVLKISLKGETENDYHESDWKNYSSLGTPAGQNAEGIRNRKLCSRCFESSHDHNEGAHERRNKDENWPGRESRMEGKEGVTVHNTSGPGVCPMLPARNLSPLCGQRAGGGLRVCIFLRSTIGSTGTKTSKPRQKVPPRREYREGHFARLALSRKWTRNFGWVSFGKHSQQVDFLVGQEIRPFDSD